jgi:phosphoribosyl-ATP pyrophosphohydrolase
VGPSINWARRRLNDDAPWGPSPGRPGRVREEEHKPEVGTIEKVIEEVEELCEAHADDDPALVLTEVADVVGALMCYVAENYPKTDFDALVRRAKAKNKAKGNKK